MTNLNTNKIHLIWTLKEPGKKSQEDTQVITKQFTYQYGKGEFGMWLIALSLSEPNHPMLQEIRTALSIIDQPKEEA